MVLYHLAAPVAIPFMGKQKSSPEGKLSAIQLFRYPSASESAAAVFWTSAVAARNSSESTRRNMPMSPTA